MRLAQILRLIGAVVGTAALGAPAQTAEITGAGSTFVYPILWKWSADYTAATGNNVNYHLIGSGGGLAQIKQATVDFGASDAPMNCGDRLYKQPRDAARTKTAMEFFRLALEHGQSQADALNYVPLPNSLVSQIEGYWKAQFPGLNGVTSCRTRSGAQRWLRAW